MSCSKKCDPQNKAKPRAKPRLQVSFLEISAQYAQCACQRGSARDFEMADGVEADENDEPSSRALAGLLAASGML